MSRILNKLFGKKGTNEKLLIGDARVAITDNEVKRLKEQHEKELKSIAPLQTKLREETTALRAVLTNKLSKSARKEVYELLKSGEDPVLVAAYLKVPFKEIAIIANNVLRDGTPKGQPVVSIPTELTEYMALFRALVEKNKETPPETAA